MVAAAWLRFFTRCTTPIHRQEHDKILLIGVPRSAAPIVLGLRAAHFTHDYWLSAGSRTFTLTTAAALDSARAICA
jgi:hypothetical protein